MILVLICTLLFKLSHWPEGSESQHCTKYKNKDPCHPKESSCNICTIKLTVKALESLALIHLLSFLTDGIIVSCLYFNKVECERRDVTQADQEAQQSLTQQHQRPAIRDSENSQGKHDAGVDHQNPGKGHREGIRGPFELVEQAVQLFHPGCVGSIEAVGSSELIIVNSTEAAQVTVTAIVAVRDSGTDYNEQVHKELHDLADTWNTHRKTMMTGKSLTN